MGEAETLKNGNAAGEVLDPDLIFKSGQFCNIRISVAKVYAWFGLIYALGSEDDLQMALDLCDTYKKTPEEKEAVIMVKALILQEASGYIYPPFNICQKYKELFSESATGVIDERQG